MESATHTTPVTPVKKVGSIRRGWQLTKSSWHILRLDKELVSLSLFSMVGSLLVLVPIVVIFIANSTFDSVGQLAQADNESLYETSLQGWEVGLLVFLTYFLTTLVANFFGAAIIHGASQRFNGNDPTLISSLAGAGRKFRPLILFSLMMTTVGLVLQILEERLPLFGRIAVWLFDAAWNIANIFAIPVIVLSRKDIQPIEATKQSVAVIKKVWGESIVVNIGIGIIGFLSFLVYLLIGSLSFALVTGGSPASSSLIAFGGIMVLGTLILMLVFSTLSSIAKAALYHYAITGEAPSDFDQVLLRNSMTPKKARKIFG